MSVRGDYETQRAVDTGMIPNSIEEKMTVMTEQKMTVLQTARETEEQLIRMSELLIRFNGRLAELGLRPGVDTSVQSEVIPNPPSDPSLAATVYRLHNQARSNCTHFEEYLGILEQELL